jgi:hypothetical protein
MKLQNTKQTSTSHSRKPYHDIMDDIDDPDLYNAVLESRNLMRCGMNPGLAFYKTANRYYVDISDVARWCGKIGERVKRSKRRVR